MTVEGKPAVGVVLEGGVVRAGDVRGSGTDGLTFAYAVAEDEGAWSFATLGGDSLRLDGGSILSAGGGLEAALSHPAASRTLLLQPAGGIWVEAPGA